MHFAGSHGGFDWDVEGMGQFGYIDGKAIHAWYVGAIGSYAFKDVPWSPRRPTVRHRVGQRRYPWHVQPAVPQQLLFRARRLHRISRHHSPQAIDNGAADRSD
jgi:hypothetical protein